MEPFSPVVVPRFRFHQDDIMKDSIIVIASLKIAKGKKEEVCI